MPKFKSKGSYVVFSYRRRSEPLAEFSTLVDAKAFAEERSHHRLHWKKEESRRQSDDPWTTTYYSDDDLFIVVKPTEARAAAQPTPKTKQQLEAEIDEALEQAALGRRHG